MILFWTSVFFFTKVFCKQPPLVNLTHKKLPVFNVAPPSGFSWYVTGTTSIFGSGVFFSRSWFVFWHWTPEGNSNDNKPPHKDPKKQPVACRVFFNSLNSDGCFFFWFGGLWYFSKPVEFSKTVLSPRSNRNFIKTPPLSSPWDLFPGLRVTQWKDLGEWSSWMPCRICSSDWTEKVLVFVFKMCDLFFQQNMQGRCFFFCLSCFFSKTFKGGFKRNDVHSFG